VGPAMCIRYRDGRLPPPMKGNHFKGPFHAPPMQWRCRRSLEERTASKTQEPVEKVRRSAAWGHVARGKGAQHPRVATGFPLPTRRSPTGSKNALGRKPPAFADRVSFPRPSPQIISADPKIRAG
jgi:hypothetical protein